MKIIINYDSIWQNSFLAGDNNSPVPKGGREFLVSSEKSRDAANYKKKEITNDTVMGVLCRLIGDQRKLYQARLDDEYYFKDMERDITFSLHNHVETDENVMLANTFSPDNRNGWKGVFKDNIPLFTAKFSPMLFGVFNLEFTDLVNFIIDDTTIKPLNTVSAPTLLARWAVLGGQKVKDIPRQDELVAVLKAKFPKVTYVKSTGKISPFEIYFGAFYIQLDRLKASGVDISSVLTKTGVVAGLSKRGVTIKDFIKGMSTGGKLYANRTPYSTNIKVPKDKKYWKDPDKPEYSTETRRLTKANGQLVISLDIPNDKAEELNTMIDNAGVSAFHLGKKGLAYITNIKR